MDRGGPYHKLDDTSWLLDSADVSKLGNRVREVFGKYKIEELEMEILNFQEDLSLKSSYATCSNIWTLMGREKYPILLSVALKLYSCFGSTFLCEVAFSSINIIKNKYRSSLTDSHLDDTLTYSSYTPDFPQLAASMQCQISH
ncbi:SCAN domain-containing protein 3-like [Lycorma delicatula]|uniref:SCAN domain-containing protein 3-like n=1 Tax=Lycorma delicatula TaxID=130591 RepID=UPI003F5186B5